MVIRDLEYYEIGFQVNQIKEVEGGRRLRTPSRTSFLELSINTIATGNHTAVVSSLDTVNQQGDRSAPSIAGFSFFYQAMVSSKPIEIL